MDIHQDVFSLCFRLGLAVRWCDLWWALHPAPGWCKLCNCSLLWRDYIYPKAKRLAGELSQGPDSILRRKEEKNPTQNLRKYIILQFWNGLCYKSLNYLKINLSQTKWVCFFWKKSLLSFERKQSMPHAKKLAYKQVPEGWEALRDNSLTNTLLSLWLKCD